MRRVELAGVAILTALGQHEPVSFQRGAGGVWPLSIGPLRPDLYVYHLVVDGVRMADPNNTVAGFTAMPPYRQLVVHGEGHSLLRVTRNRARVADVAAFTERLRAAPLQVSRSGHAGRPGGRSWRVAGPMEEP